MAYDYHIIDADHHTFFPKDYYRKWWPKTMQDLAPKLVKDPAGGDSWLWGGKVFEPLGLNSTAGIPYERFKYIGLKWEEVRKGLYDPKERLKDMDQDGVDACVLFSDNRSAMALLRYASGNQQLEAVKAYNNYMLQEWQGTNPDRIVGLAQMPNAGVEGNVAELTRVKKLGARGIIPRNWPSGKNEVSSEDDPFWAACQEMDIPVANHNGDLRQGGMASLLELNDKGQLPDQGGPKGVGMFGTGGNAPTFVQRMILSGVFDRFPKLRVGCIETNCGWIPGLLEGLDDRYWRNRHWTGVKLKYMPSEYWVRNFYVTFMVDKFGVQKCRDILGVQTMQWSSDYPHHGNDWPNSRMVIDSVMYGVPPAEREKMLWENCAKTYGLI